MNKLITNLEPETHLEDIQSYWRKRGQDLVESSIESLDETAKQIVAISGILEGFYFHAITFSDIRNGLVTNWEKTIYLIPPILLLFSLVTALMVFFPETFHVNLLSWDACKIAYERVAAGKRTLVKFGAILLTLGIVAMSFSLLLYLNM